MAIFSSPVQDRRGNDLHEGDRVRVEDGGEMVPAVVTDASGRRSCHVRYADGSVAHVDSDRCVKMETTLMALSPGARVRVTGNTWTPKGTEGVVKEPGEIYLSPGSVLVSFPGQGTQGVFDEKDLTKMEARAFETRRSDGAREVGDCAACRRRSLDTTRSSLDVHSPDAFDLFMAKTCSGSGRPAENLRWEMPGGYATHERATQTTLMSNVTDWFRAGARGPVPALSPDEQRKYDAWRAKGDKYDSDKNLVQWIRDTLANGGTMEAAFDAVDMARTAVCSYCAKTVAMSARVLGVHRAADGVCPGASCRVASFDAIGRAVFETQTFANLDDFKVGDRVRGLNVSGSGFNEEAVVTEIRGYSLVVKFLSDGSTAIKHFTNVDKI